MLKDPPKTTDKRAAAVFVALGGSPLAFKRCKFCQSLQHIGLLGKCDAIGCVKARAKEVADAALAKQRARHQGEK
jgi:hypothetical protein